ncbi:DUF4412 domain-containing protein [Mariniflexile litorale]|uniref:DUF4412 domain-containing protein n=1 Tax=Mariniflexile litorale TaxID=3045158 RepID=A0AAU7EDP5_9FLAO|nr:DUF4412 domain-containing protein [Mariniflexile sp. KMM 9835]MDQ8212928.1 DUF4412 domain-containing protein [Mariniflexile sp. KMM 9835]
MKTSKNNTSILLNISKAVFLVIVFCFTTITNAQFLKKLGNKIENAAQKTVEKKVEAKTEKETNKAFDSTFNKTSKKKNKENSPIVSKSAVAPASTYSFTHIYTMQMVDNKRSTNLEYYLTPSGNYFATRILDGNDKNTTISVMDLTQKTIHTLMDNKGDKSRISMALNLNKSSNYMIDQTNIKVTPTGTTKTIVGYTCEGYKVVGGTVEGTVWVTQDAGISFSKHMYKSDPSQPQDAIFKKLITGLTLEMDMVDTSRKKDKPIHMMCIKLEKSSTTINTSSYKKLM